MTTSPAGLTGGQPCGAQGIALQIVFKHADPAALMPAAVVVDAEESGD